MICRMFCVIFLNELYNAFFMCRSLVYDRNKTMFYTGESRSLNVTHDFFITNTFNFTVVIYNISLHPVIKSSFTVSSRIFSALFFFSCGVCYTNCSVCQLAFYAYYHIRAGNAVRPCSGMAALLRHINCRIIIY